MPAVCVIGSQWGDEGKGKVVDILGENADYVIRYQGGNNAGHTVVIDGKKNASHILPSGVFREDIRVLIASKVVLDPRQLTEEMGGFGDINLGIDPRTAIIMPWHNDLDKANEIARKKKTGSEIGTTRKGIGPCYGDDTERFGIRFSHLVGDPKKLEDMIRSDYEKKEKILATEGVAPSQDIDKIVEEYLSLGKALRKYKVDVSLEVSKAIKEKKNIIFEGAQGTLLDIKYGNYPYVTPSHPMSGEIFPSVGIPPMKLRTIGIAKAYVTKVGDGPVVTCLDKGLWPVDELQSAPEGNYIRHKGHEEGTTSGRPRRVGWMDLVVLNYTHRINGFSELALMKLDVLSGLDEIYMAHAYIHNPTGKIVQDYRAWDIDFLNDCKPLYEKFDGFDEDISKARSPEELPNNARKYMERIEQVVNVPITLISVGPDREETIYRGFKKFN